MARNPDSKFLLLFGSIFGGVGSIIAIVGIALGISTHSYLSKMVSTPGTVIDNNLYLSTDNENEPTNYYHPVVKFTPKSGKMTIFVANVASNPPVFKKGQQVTVLYDPKDPSAAKIESWLELWFLPTMLGGLGSVFATIGGIAIVKSCWRS
ncbi:DUF3592 domain-containing protein [Chamaesiphon polymorphus]|uniref:DUF3592 domain-containing protein n=1 Tax=Chamaesiphon polymorphus CCALA 037 TaxID=2107692 RepID=A0A2T1F5E6_9CYAN|nr:DUF3592 domain-containing protein [Chamaesiphon polymorphus]PSB40184.1 DUF3592 domain-containing protein [Chamaesiphon polymorphus CCALA 037]